MEKYYLISGKALININFRNSKTWLKPSEGFSNQVITESDLKKYRRFLVIDLQLECDENGQVKKKAQPKVTEEVVA
jgi:hypothetical protein